MDEYVSNSLKSKEQEKEKTPEKRVEKPVVQVPAKTRKKGELRKFSDVFISEDASNVKSYILQDVLLPTIKDTISNIIKSSVDMILFGEARRGDSSKSGGYKPSYRSYYDDRNDSYRRRDTYTPYSFDDVLLDSRADAEEVLNGLIDIVEKYGVVSVADLYDLVGIVGVYTDNKYGWTDLRTARIERDRSGAYYIKLPRALPL